MKNINNRIHLYKTLYDDYISLQFFFLTVNID